MRTSPKARLHNAARSRVEDRESLQGLSKATILVEIARLAPPKGNNDTGVCLTLLTECESTITRQIREKAYS